MTLADQIVLMEDLIRENADVTIGEYFSLIKEIERIEEAHTGRGR